MANASGTARWQVKTLPGKRKPAQNMELQLTMSGLYKKCKKAMNYALLCVSSSKSAFSSIDGMKDF